MHLAGVNFKNSFNAIWIRTGPRSLKIMLAHWTSEDKDPLTTIVNIKIH